MENRVQVEQMLTLLSQAPDSQLDLKIGKELKELIGKSKEEIKTGVRKAIDLCVFGSLASGFAMQALNILYTMDLGGTMEDFTEKNCPWRIK